MEVPPQAIVIAYRTSQGSKPGKPGIPGASSVRGMKSMTQATAAKTTASAQTTTSTPASIALATDTATATATVADPAATVPVMPASATLAYATTIPAAPMPVSTVPTATVALAPAAPATTIPIAPASATTATVQGITANIADRVRGIPANPFAAANARVAEYRAAGHGIIDLSQGNPDGEPPQFMIDALAEAAQDPADFKYPAFSGKPAFLKAAAGWYRREFGVTLDPTTQLLATAGASVGISAVIQTLVNAGDLVVLVGPYYPQYEGSTAVVQGRIYTIATSPERGFLPDLDAVPQEIWDQAKLLILNYPNNPTGAVATPELFETAVRIGKEHHVVIVNDFAYAGIGYDAQPPISLLSTPGALDVSLELCSLSKMYMIAGWRGGFVAGNAQLMTAVKSVHAQTSLLVSSIVQDAGTAGLNSDQSTVRALANRYHRRYLALRDGLAEADLHLTDSHGGLFAWMPVPNGDDQAFARWLIDKAGVAVISGSDFGPTGAGYVRFSLLMPEETLTQAAHRIRDARGDAW